MSIKTDHELDGSDRELFDLIRKALADLRFGHVVIAVHDGKIVQVERTEKIRPLVERSTRGRL